MTRIDEEIHMTEDSHKSKIDSISAYDIMTENVAVVDKYKPIGQVAHLMLRERVSGYPVVDENGRVVGIVTITDLFILLNKMAKGELSDSQAGATIGEQIASYKDRPISDIMSRDVKSISPDTRLSEIVQATVESNIHMFPVMKDEKLVGIIGRHDVLNATFVYG